MKNQPAGAEPCAVGPIKSGRLVDRLPRQRAALPLNHLIDQEKI